MTFLGRHYTQFFRVVPVIEGAALVLGVYIAVAVLRPESAQMVVDGTLPRVWPGAMFFAAVMLILLTAMGLYNIRLREVTEGLILRAFLACLIGGGSLAILNQVAVGFLPGGGVIFLSTALAFGGLALTRSFLGKAINHPANRRRVMVLGAGSKAQWLTRLRRRTDLVAAQIVGFVPFNGETSSIPDSQRLAIDGPLSQWAETQRIDEIVVAPDERRRALPMDELMACRANGLLITDLNSFIERETGSVRISESLPAWLTFSTGHRALFVGERAKRLFDISVSVLLLLAASPVMVLAVVALWLESKGRDPIFYTQRRVRKDGAEFDVFKFRSMHDGAEKPGAPQWAVRDDPRITAVGAVLRRFRIDELPQIYNVLRGDMSFVGPRPERPEFVSELQRSHPLYAWRHRVNPGLTGWAQIRYPYGASEEDAVEKLRYDLYYVKNRSLLMDLMILLQTAEVVLWGRGAR